ncbi:MAG: sigma 54-interacting transcriptional regulator [bacterium]
MEEKSRHAEMNHQGLEHLDHLKASLEELHRFKALLFELSAKFASLALDEIDGEIENGLELIARFLDIDRAHLLELTEDGPEAYVTHAYARGGIPTYVGLQGSSQFPWAFQRIRQGNVVRFSRAEEEIKKPTKDREFVAREGIKSLLAIPLKVSGSIVGALSFTTFSSYRSWPDELVKDLNLVGEVFANAILRKRDQERLQKAFAEIKGLKEQIEADCKYLRQEIEVQHDFHNMIGQSEPLLDTLAQIRTVAPTDVTVLVLGETGTGKELVARAIHEASRRRKRPLVKVDCAALPASLIESELFGHERGAFTGAHARRTGRFELAKGTTIFLDEIGELSLEVQTKLLRLLQEGSFERLGSSTTLQADVRIIAATNKDLDLEVREGRFRKDLWYRLNVFPIRVPALRERRQDIPLLVRWFVDKYGKKLGKKIRLIQESDMRRLQAYPWPGNVRELENLMQRAVVNTQGPQLQLVEKLGYLAGAEFPLEPKGSLEAVERAYMIRVLEQTDWIVHGPRGAARILGLNPSTLRSRMKKLRIRRPTP